MLGPVLLAFILKEEKTRNRELAGVLQSRGSSASLFRLAANRQPWKLVSQPRESKEEDVTGRRSSKDKGEGAMDRAKGRVREASDALTEDREKKSDRQDRGEGAIDKAKGRAKEASGALTGDEERKAEGRSDQRKGTIKEKKGYLKDLFK